MNTTRANITRTLSEMVQSGHCEEKYVDAVYDAIDMLNAHAEEPEPDKEYVCLSDIQKFPIRENHHDKKHGNIHFINGIETIIEYVESLPRYKV